MRTVLLVAFLSGAALYSIGLSIINLQALAYKLVQLTIAIIFVHFLRKELFPYHDQEECSDLRALGMLIFMGLVILSFMLGL